MDMDQRVHFYSAMDLSIGWQFARIDELIAFKDSWSSLTDINDVIELFEAQQVLESCALKDEKYAVISDIKKVLGRYFSGINSENIGSVLEQVDIWYKDDFWQLTALYAAYNHVDAQCFSELMHLDSFNILNVLHQKKLVFHYGHEIREYLMNNVSYASLLISEYLEEETSNKEKFYFPDCLTIQDRVQLLWKYIEDPDSDVNSLELISKSRGNDRLPISPELKLAAKRRYQSNIERLFEGAPTMTFGVNIIFRVLPDNEYEIHECENGLFKMEYNIKWIEENKDAATLLNNFIYLFGFVDHQFRWTHVSRTGDVDVIERMIGMKGQREYIIGTGFTASEMLGNAQIQGYTNVLKGFGIEIESIIKWFFMDYLPTEFQVGGFYFNKPSVGSSYLEKCRDLVIEMDSIFKQFILYCRHGEIDRELLEISTEHMLVANVPSMYQNKYMYPTGENFKNAASILFSNQSLAYYIKGKTDKYSSLYETLANTTLNINELQTWQRRSIEYLIESDFLTKDGTGLLCYDKLLLSLMYDLFINDCANTAYLKGFEKQVTFLERKGMVRYGSTLLSEPEQHYYNYIFNGSEYDNSLDLRNKYAHGSQIPDEKSDQINYYIILRLFILSILKINEEFCLRENDKQ